MDKAEGASVSSGLVRIPRSYIQGERGRVIVEAEEPTRFVAGNESDPLKTFGQDELAGAGRYIAYAKRLEYAVKITRSAKLRLWYHAYFPTAGNWNHTERLDNGDERFVTDHSTKDPNDPTLKKWLWKKGAEYDFSVGEHTFFMDWQGGARLDQLVFLPEEDAVPEENSLNATYGDMAEKGSLTTMPVMLRASQKLRKLDTKIETSGGRVEIYLSSDQGGNWAIIPDDGSLGGFEFKDEKQLLFKYVLYAAGNHASPLVLPGYLTVVATGNAPIPKAGKDIIFKEESICLTPSIWSGIRPDETGWKLAEALQPDEKNVIWLDAAQADQTVFANRQGAWIQEDKDAFSGKAVYQGDQGGCNLISFDIAVAGAVKCRPWFRIKLFKPDVRAMGDLGGMSQYAPQVKYQFDRNDLVTVNYKLEKKDFPVAAFQKQEWIWVPGRPVSLEAGPHVFRVREGFAYILLDRIALVCGDGPAPEGKGAVSPKVMAKEGEVVFHAVNTVGVKDITAIKADGELAGSTIAYSISVDQGKVFKPLSEAKKDTQGKPQNGFIVKATIKAGQKNDRLHVGRFVAELAGAGRIGMELSNAEQRILFDGSTGMLTGWWTKKVGWIIPQGYVQSCFSFLMGGTENGFSLMEQNSAELVDIQTSTTKGVKTLLLKYTLADDLVSALVQIDLPPTGLAQWNLKLINRSPQDLKSIKFPLISGLRMGNDPERNRTINLNNMMPGAPVITGLLYRTPIRNSEIYPGQYNMGWLSLYNDMGAFTAQVRDTDKVGTQVSLEPDDNAIAGRIQFERLLTIEPGKERESRYALGFHEGDWHQSANFYSQWAHSWMDFSYVNKNWAKDADGWVAGWHFVSGWMATRYMTHLVPEMEWLGASYMQHFANGIEATCSEATMFVHNPKYGSLADFRKAHAESAKRGVYHTYYTPTRQFTDLHAVNDAIGPTPRELLPPEIKMYPPGFGVKWGGMDEAGKVRPSGYNMPTFCVQLCPASEGGRERMVEGIATNYCGLVGAQGVYSDEACGFVTCFNTKHDHGKQYGLWAKGLQDNYKESLDIARKNNSDAVIGACEGSPDQLLQYAEFGLAAPWPALPLMFTFPEIKLLGQATDPVGSREENAHYQHLFLRINRMVYTPGSNDRQFFAHRKRMKDWMYGCRFMDDIGLTASRPGIITKWFQREDAEHTGALINIQNEFAFEGATVTLRSPLVKDAKFALAYLLDEEEVVKVVCENGKDGLKIAVPKAKASSILIPVRFPAKEAIRAHLVWPQAPGADKLVLFVVNMSGEAKTVSLGYTSPEGIALTALPADLQIPPMDLKRIEIPITGVNVMSKHERVTVTVKAETTTVSCNALLAPVLYNGGFENDSAGKGTPDAWRIFGFSWFAYLLQNLTLSFDLNHADGILDSQNPAEGKYSLRLDGKMPIPVFGNDSKAMWAKERREERLKLAKIVPWVFQTGQLLILKPETRYQISFKYRTAADDGRIEVNSEVYDFEDANPSFFPVQKISAPKGDRTWQSHTFQFTTPVNRSECVLVFRNNSDQPAWIDNVKVVEMDKAR
ncbi:MAG: hypothetical protein WCS96_08850 [Victivallales bacterium]